MWKELWARMNQPVTFTPWSTAAFIGVPVALVAVVRLIMWSDRAAAAAGALFAATAAVVAVTVTAWLARRNEIEREQRSLEMDRQSTALLLHAFMVTAALVNEKLRKALRETIAAKKSLPAKQVARQLISAATPIPDRIDAGIGKLTSGDIIGMAILYENNAVAHRFSAEDLLAESEGKMLDPKALQQICEDLTAVIGAADECVNELRKAKFI
jgi:hypothetical protein